MTQHRAQKVLTIIVSLAIGLAAERQIAPGWTSPDSSDYQAAIDHTVVHSGHGSLLMKWVGGTAKDYAARQQIRADAYRGKRIRLSGWLKPDRAEGGGALWLRVDMKNGDYILDSMLDITASDHPAKDAKGWTQCVLVSDVPDDALGISFGLRMKGKGEIWADDLALDVTTKSVMTTTIERRPNRAAVQQLNDQYAKAPMRPVNMGFEQP